MNEKGSKDAFDLVGMRGKAARWPTDDLRRDPRMALPAHNDGELARADISAGFGIAPASANWSHSILVSQNRVTARVTGCAW